MYGIDKIINIHKLLYKEMQMELDADYDYLPHMTVGKLSSDKLLDSAFDDVIKYNDIFSTEVKKISVEMIGKHQ